MFSAYQTFFCWQFQLAQQCSLILLNLSRTFSTLTDSIQHLIRNAPRSRYRHRARNFSARTSLSSDSFRSSPYTHDFVVGPSAWLLIHLARSFPCIIYIVDGLSLFSTSSYSATRETVPNTHLHLYNPFRSMVLLYHVNLLPWLWTIVGVLLSLFCL